ncbi:MAG TPA: glycine cleavage system protein T, partial [Candidatus Polarisedimenticolia bacterium]|nr:glycine cleavage system protein T [Candidatus Polarisedimenticolia bacterium]
MAPPIPDPATQHRLAVAGAVFAERPDLGRLLIAGKDAADLLHRLSTNAVKTLKEGQGVATVFTTHKGRILDL